MGQARAAIYCRISDDRSGKEAGVDLQREECLELLAANGWELVPDGPKDTFVDNDKSAFSGRTRPAYERLVEAIKRGELDQIVTRHIDRLYRRPVELEALITLVETTKVLISTVKAGDFDLSTRQGITMARLGVTIANDASMATRERVQARMVDNAEKGKVHGMLRTYGMRGTRNPDGSHTWEVVEEEAAVIREAADRVLGGEGILSIVIDLNERGIPSLRGKQWARNTLRNMLISARVCGWREHTPGRSQSGPGVWGGGEFVAKAEWPEILPKATVVKLRRLLGDPARQRGRNGRSYLLSGGLAVCAVCGHNLRGRPNHAARSYYCAPVNGNGSGCGKVSVNADGLEAYVIEQVREALRDGSLAEKVAALAEGANADQAWSKVAALREDRDALAADHGAGTITRAEWMAAREPLLARLAVAEADLARRQVHDSAALLAGGLPEWDRKWTAAEEAGLLDQQRALLRAALTAVAVAPALVPGLNRFDSERVTEDWRV